MNKSNIVRAIDISYTVPELPKQMVYRPHLINSLLNFYDSDTEVIAIEGRPGYGKTTLLREFSITVDEPCFGVFLRAGSRLSYDPVLARVDLANQLHWHLTSKRLSDRTEPTDGDLRNLWRRTAHKINREKKSCYVIVDGLHHIPQEDEPLTQAILSLLPFGVRPFRFLFSTDVDSNSTLYDQRLKVKPFPIMAFAAHESDEYLLDVLQDNSMRASYHNACRGVPSLLASVRRQLLASSDPTTDSVLDYSTDLQSLFQAEWDKVLEFTQAVENAVAFLLAYGRPVDSATLAKHCSTTTEKIEKNFKGISFLRYSYKLSGWEFTSDLFAQFAKDKLLKSVQSMRETIASNLLQEPDSALSLEQLPIYLGKIEKTEKLVQWLTEQRLAALILKTKTAASIDSTLTQAIDVCHDARNDQALTSYSLCRSIISQVSRVSGIDDEIRARGVLGDFDGAVEVVNSVPLLAQRLRLLSVLVHAFSETPGVQVQPLKDEIRKLVDQIDIENLPREEAIDLAIDLYPVDPSLALGMLRNIIEDDLEDSSFEIALARISLSALYLKSLSGEEVSGDDNRPVPQDLVVDEKLRHFLGAAKVFYGAKSAEQVLEATKGIEDPSERLFIQRKWLVAHPKRKDSIDLVENSINYAISTISYKPNAGFYREISTPLPYVEEGGRRKQAVAIIDGQKEIIQNKGPTIEFVRLQLQLAHCDSVDKKYSRAIRRLEDLYLESIDNIVDLETKAACLAWFEAALTKLKLKAPRDTFEDIDNAIAGELNDAISNVMSECADQLEILSEALRPLALELPEMAMEVAGQLNTSDRRNSAFLHIISTICDEHPLPDVDTLSGALDALDQGNDFDAAMAIIADRITDEELSSYLSAEDLRRVVGHTKRCLSPYIKAECLAKVSVALESHGHPDELKDSTGQLLRDAFGSIGSPNVKYRLACQLIAILRPKCSQLATEIFEFLAGPTRVTSFRENVEDCAYYILDLAIKSTCALAASKLLRSDDITRVCQMVSQVRDPHLAIKVLSALALYLRREDYMKECSDVVNQRILPALLGLPVSDNILQHKAWISAYPAVWLEDRDQARKSIERFPRSVKDECIAALCYALLRRQPAGEPFDRASQNRRSPLEYADIKHLLRLCEETEEDFTICSVFEWIADEVGSNRSMARVTRDQKAEISRSMVDIANRRLPVPHRIQHAGYQILCKAHATRIFETRSISWESLISEAESLTNSADRIFVLANIASYLPAKYKKKRKSLFQQAEQEADKLNSVEDQFGRYYTIAVEAQKKEKPTALRIVRKAFGKIAGGLEGRTTAKERELVDLAQRLDPELPMKLAVLYDDDPARRQYRERAKKQLDADQLRKDIADNRSSMDLTSRHDDKALALAAWNALAALNSGRMIPVHM